MSSANQPANDVSWQPPDHRLYGIRAALAMLEVPANDGAFDDLLRQLDAIAPAPPLEPGEVVRPLADVRRARELWALRLRHRVMRYTAGRGVGRRSGTA